nr:MAG TPA: hypothetical protein [Caudoviricetes sp.]
MHGQHVLCCQPLCRTTMVEMNLTLDRRSKL